MVNEQPFALTQRSCAIIFKCYDPRKALPYLAADIDAVKNSHINKTQKLAMILCLLFPLYVRAEQFVELTAEIEMDGFARSTEPKTSIVTPTSTVRCVVGTNTWMMTGDFYSNEKATYWFTGSNIVERVGEGVVRVSESLDGNPGRPLRVSDAMHTLGNISWLAFCSGSFLKHDAREIYPPSSIWKQIGPWPFTDRTEVFEDRLGLPRSVKLFKTNDQTVFQYQVHESTNILGWNFPLEFSMAQYVRERILPVRTNGYELRFTAKGRVTSIKEGTRPEIPAEVWNAIGKRR